MQRIFNYLPEAELEEAQFLNSLLKDKPDEEFRNILYIYRSRRRDPQIILLTTLIGFLGFAGIQRFLINQIGMGVLYFFTMGFCFIGTIVDLINHKSLATEYNRKVAFQVMALFENQ
ncbi:TM2 domain-containing protein [Alkalitalea saponilacus]|uniref:TM2 domain-containing protein n=1 Tax=Alkalitalea saponilacus TaxID=889453 RepID=A0A1T5B9X0_9BACT|nr:TM2 domain-containing protein [Alkalitalea saponilacus]ASB49736.1 hypothetical protein CDL62_11605 [Alkalitalea saponilacus]SKB44042.1 TM2 domain-containing protein [Alkalitalea saponilacus]